MKKIITKSELETYNLGREAGLACRGGEVYLLCGELGTGKTKFAQGLAEGLGVKAQVNSPTFNILKLYEEKGAVRSFCHIDAYRLNSGQDLEALGIAEMFSDSRLVTLIEWAERVKSIWPVGAKLVKLRVLGKETREIIF